MHTHVETFAELQLQRKGKAPAAASNAKPFDLTNLIRRAEEQMMTRAQQMASLLESSGGHYQMEVVTGAVPDELERTAVACRADVAIFGQHKVFHRHGMHVGQVPFKAMLVQGRPVIVVPHAGSV